MTTLAGKSGQMGSADGTGGGARFALPYGVATYTNPSGNVTVYVADHNNDTIRAISPTGIVTTLAGSAGQAGFANGSGAGARFDRPTGVATDAAGNVYVSDYGNNCIRKITPAGDVSTFAGMPNQPGHVDGPGTGAKFNFPLGLATNAGGYVYVADGNSIRKITPVGSVSTLAGGAPGYQDGAAANAAFRRPMGVATDSFGDVFVADGNNCIRKIANGMVSTLAGSATQVGAADGSGANARFNSPCDLATDDAGNVYVADSYNQTIREITLGTLNEDASFTVVDDHREEDTDLDTAAEDASIIRFVNQVLRDAIELRASDIHLEPFEAEFRIRYRIDGVLQDVPVPAQIKRFQPAIVSRVKILSHLNIAEKRLPQDGRINSD